MYICPKVRVADLIDVDLPTQRLEFWQNFNKISQKHIDFVICNKDDFLVKLAIELDDKSHSLDERLRRDRFVDKVFKEANIPILHIQVSQYYNPEFIKEQIDKILDH